GRWLAVQAMPLDGADGRRAVVLTVDAASPTSIGQLALAARGLTVREQDVAQLVLQGASTKAIAATLHLSPHTVQDHLKSIFAKLGVRSRREMIAQLVLVDGASAG
ncbi:helix-turn-helix transcriptional regulator, partial [uncultured Jatrophihabitans sp.]|uniref:helix-turn-helix domain-containing protein n=1 Tax=uncultured Jatrophihabitans sp. TaxID=1610747 RepID=UPI0035C9A9ED